jgi:hypothetical protein
MGGGKVLACAWALLGGAGALFGCVEDSPKDHETGRGMDAGVVDAGSGRGAEPTECNVTAPTSCPEPAPRYADIGPIIQSRCVICHVGSRGGPWALVSYQHVADWHDLIRGVMLSCAMPPPDAGVPMTVEEREVILTWLRCGHPR